MVSPIEIFTDHPVFYSEIIIFDEALVMKSGMSWHAPDTIFMGFLLVFGPQTEFKLSSLLLPFYNLILQLSMVLVLSKWSKTMILWLDLTYGQ
jgi:hypothetical protein